MTTKDKVTVRLHNTYRNATGGTVKITGYVPNSDTTDFIGDNGCKYRSTGEVLFNSEQHLAGGDLVELINNTWLSD